MLFKELPRFVQRIIREENLYHVNEQELEYQHLSTLFTWNESKYTAHCWHDMDLGDPYPLLSLTKYKCALFPKKLWKMIEEECVRQGYSFNLDGFIEFYENYECAPGSMIDYTDTIQGFDYWHKLINEKNFSLLVEIGTTISNEAHSEFQVGEVFLERKNKIKWVLYYNDNTESPKFVQLEDINTPKEIESARYIRWNNFTITEEKVVIDPLDHQGFYKLLQHADLEGTKYIFVDETCPDDNGKVVTLVFNDKTSMPQFQFEDGRKRFIKWNCMKPYTHTHSQFNISTQNGKDNCTISNNTIISSATPTISIAEIRCGISICGNAKEIRMGC